MAHVYKQTDEVLSLTGDTGIHLASKKGGLSFDSDGDESFVILSTKNLALLRAGKNSVALYEDKLTGGMIDIQGHPDGAINLAVQEATVKNTALTITDGQAHLGVFKPAAFDRFYVENGKSVIESSVGVPNGPATKLGKVEVTPTKVTISNLESKMEVDLDGFTWENTAKTFKMVLKTTKFSVEDSLGTNKFEIDLATQTVTIKGMKLELDSTIQTFIQNLENKITIDVATAKAEAIAEIKNQADAIKSDQATINKQNTDAIADINFQITTLKNCWVARAVFGETDIRWRLFRHWLFGDRFHPEQGTWLQRSYLRHGPWVAEVVRRCPPLRWALYLCMSHCIRGLHAVPHGAFGRASVSAPLSLSHHL